MMKVWKIAKPILYSVIAILIFIFHPFFISHVSFLVGTTMIVFALEKLIIFASRHGNPLKSLENALHIASLFAGILMMTLLGGTKGNPDVIIKVCMIWAIWSILQEVIELFEMMELIKEYRIGFISALESIIIIVLSVMLIHDPIEHYSLHVIILGFELILNFAFPFFHDILKNRKIKKESSQEK